MLPPNLHEYKYLYEGELWSATWKFSRDERRRDCVVHEMHKFWPAGARKEHHRSASGL